MNYPPSQDPSVSADPGNFTDSRDHLIRHEEQLHVSTERVPAGVARLEKFLVTEVRTITVELTHEEVRLVHGPSTDSDSEGRTSGIPAGKNTARWMYVNREEIIVGKRVTPVERVRLEVYPVTETRQITEQIRKERITDNRKT